MSNERLRIESTGGQHTEPPGPIFVRETAMTASVPVDVVPAVLRSRLLSIEAYNVDHRMIEADVVDGHQLESCLMRVFQRSEIAYAHMHFARPGYFACRVDRA